MGLMEGGRFFAASTHMKPLDGAFRRFSASPEGSVSSQHFDRHFPIASFIATLKNDLSRFTCAARLRALTYCRRQFLSSPKDDNSPAYMPHPRVPLYAGVFLLDWT